jgi:hypothetical protein
MADKANVLVGAVSVTVGVGLTAKVLGYTSDGVDLTVRSEFANLKVEEREGANLRRLIDQEVEVTLKMAEGDLASLAAAIPGASLTAPTLTIGGTALQEARLTLMGKTPASRDRVIILSAVTPTGEVGVPYKKGEVSVIPVTFSALVSDSSEFGSFFDAAAAAPALVVGANTKSNAAGTLIEAKFSKAMAAPTGKHGEFWFTEADFGSPRVFSAAALHGGDNTILDLTVSGVAITAGKTLQLNYALGSVGAGDDGVLASFSNQAVIARP